MTRGALDIWLDRGVKTIGILGFVGAAFMVVNGFLTLPVSIAETKENLASTKLEVKELSEYRNKTDLTLQAIQQDASYTKEKVEKIDTKVDRIYVLMNSRDDSWKRS